CENRVCNPRMGNLATGRSMLTDTQCGSTTPEHLCRYDDGSCIPQCEVCHPHAHPPTSMTDSSFKQPPTWWQSAGDVINETLQLNLEVEFYFTHLIVIFHSPRPAAMTVERSRDFGRTWSTLHSYSRNCSSWFGLKDGHGCTEKYSSPRPCSGGEVIYRALSPWSELEPYSSEARAQLGITNLRVQLLQPQQCPCQLKQSNTNLLNVPYAISDFILKGACLCHGHSEQCVPASSYQATHNRGHHVVHGKCVCRHHTAGDHCERCDRLYNDRPWRPASGLTGEAHQCNECKCNGHAESCHFDKSLWLRSGQRSGGVCHCLHNTTGRHCQQCQPGFYRHPERLLTAENSCTLCSRQINHHILTHRCDISPHNQGVSIMFFSGCVHVAASSMHIWNQTSCHDEYEQTIIIIPWVNSSVLFKEYPEHNNTIFRAEELFSALNFQEKCECKQQSLKNSKIFCIMQYSYALKVRVLAAHDKGSHAEVDVKVLKVLWNSSTLRLMQGTATLYPESWTTRGCTCPVLYPGEEYLVAGHYDVRKGRLLVNMKSLVKPWRANHSRRVLQLLR
ncbi:netrin-4 isoform X1, partial [Silurus meridionalis]